jgi:hypothetical protein
LTITGIENLSGESTENPMLLHLENIKKVEEPVVPLNASLDFAGGRNTEGIKKVSFLMSD